MFETLSCDVKPFPCAQNYFQTNIYTSIKVEKHQKCNNKPKINSWGRFRWITDEKHKNIIIFCKICSLIGRGSRPFAATHSLPRGRERPGPSQNQATRCAVCDVLRVSWTKRKKMLKDVMLTTYITSARQRNNLCPWRKSNPCPPERCLFVPDKQQSYLWRKKKKKNKSTGPNLVSLFSLSALKSFFSFRTLTKKKKISNMEHIRQQWR